jgi:hypothetical protein
MEIKKTASKIKIFETPDLLYCSITVCVVALNINIEGKKKGFENFVRLILMGVGVVDVFMLGMIYSGNAGVNSTTFSIVSASVPILIAPFYQLYIVKRDGVKGEATNVA